MTCAICGGYRPSNLPSYLICNSCFLAAISLTDNENGSDILQINSSVSSTTQNQGLENVLKKVKDKEEESKGKLRFLGEFVAALKEGIHSDILVRPGSNGPSIPAHKALLATRSEIFKNMLDSDKCKAPAGDTITFEELNHEELEAFLEFLYTGDFPKSKMEKHVYSLSVAADKYEIAFLQKFCERHMLGSISSSNVLDILETADTCSNQALKEAALNFIVKNIESVISSQRYEAFSLNNHHLSLEITRAICGDIKNRSGKSTSNNGHSQKLPQQDLAVVWQNQPESLQKIVAARHNRVAALLAALQNRAAALQNRAAKRQAALQNQAAKRQAALQNRVAVRQAVLQNRAAARQSRVAARHNRVAARQAALQNRAAARQAALQNQAAARQAALQNRAAARQAALQNRAAVRQAALQNRVAARQAAGGISRQRCRIEWRRG